MISAVMVGQKRLQGGMVMTMMMVTRTVHWLLEMGGNGNGDCWQTPAFQKESSNCYGCVLHSYIEGALSIFL